MFTACQSGCRSRFDVTITLPVFESPLEQSKRSDADAYNTVLDTVSDIFFLFGAICMFKPGFEEFKSECPVMEFEESSLNGAAGVSVTEMDVDSEYPGIEYVDFNSNKLPVLPVDKVKAVDLWSIVKSAETYPLSEGIGYTVQGIDPSIFFSPVLFGHNQRLARRVNNMGTVSSLLYHILDAGFYDVVNNCVDAIELGEKMAPLLADIQPEALFKFRNDSYYDSVLFHQFLAQGVMVYLDTCSRNSIPSHNKLEKQQFGKVRNMPLTVPNSLSLNAFTNTTKVTKVEDDILVTSFILSYLPQQNTDNELNSVSLRTSLK